jgi:hypothetical protein
MTTKGGVSPWTKAKYKENKGKGKATLRAEKGKGNPTGRLWERAQKGSRKAPERHRKAPERPARGDPPPPS